MTTTIQVMPNQSLPDVILQAYGTLEGGMYMMKANGRSISDYPLVGEVLTVYGGQPAFSDTAMLKYLHENAIIIGTLGTHGIVSFRTILKPMMEVIPTTASAPSTTGDYQFDLKAAPGFFHLYTIPHALYPSDINVLWYLPEDSYILHDMPSGNLTPGNYMDDMRLSYRLAWTSGHGFMLAWIDLGAVDKTATFVDAMGNRAYAAPLIVLDNVTQNVEEYLIADIDIEMVSANTTTATLRLTRSHTGVAHADFSTYTMTWLNDAAAGTPDPADPTNPNKTILVLPRGIYSFGVGTTYTNGATTYPPSAFTEVIELL